MSDTYGVIEQNGKFIVTKNNKILQLPKSDGASIVTEFDSREDAEKYIGIVKRLKQNKMYA